MFTGVFFSHPPYPCIPEKIANIFFYVFRASKFPHATCVMCVMHGSVYVLNIYHLVNDSSIMLIVNSAND